MDLNAEMPTRANQMETELLLAWAAGFIDGEGCVSVYDTAQAKDRNPQFQSVITVSQTNILPLNKLQSLFGGSVSPVRQPDYDGQCWVWRVFGDNVLSTSRLLLSHSIVKKRQLELLIEFQMTKNRNRWEDVPLEIHAHRAAIHAELRGLNSKRKRLDAERLSEETPKRLGRPPKSKGDAIVRTRENENREKPAETTGSVH